MRDQRVGAPEPFVAATAALAVATLGEFRLPESFVAVMERGALLQGARGSLGASVPPRARA